MSIRAPKKRLVTPVRRAKSAALLFRKSFGDLVDDPELLARVTLGFEAIISSSFMPGRNPVRDGVPTVGHVKERFTILEK